MNTLLENGNRMFAYSIDGLWDSVKMNSSYLASASKSASENMISNDEKTLFIANLQTIMNDVFFHLSVLAKNVDDACKVVAGVPQQLEPITIGSGNMQDSIPGGQPPAAWLTDHIVYELTLPTYWSLNLLGTLDSAIYDTLIHNTLMKMYRTRGQMDYFQLSRDKYEGDCVMIKSLINYRRQAAKKTYRAF